MPRLLAHVPINLDELFQDSRVAPSAAVSKACRVVEVAVNTIFVFVIRVLSTEEGLQRTLGLVYPIVEMG